MRNIKSHPSPTIHSSNQIQSPQGRPISSQSLSRHPVSVQTISTECGVRARVGWMTSPRSWVKKQKTEINLTERFHWLQAPGTQERGCSISCGSLANRTNVRKGRLLLGKYGTDDGQMNEEVMIHRQVILTQVSVCVLHWCTAIQAWFTMSVARGSCWQYGNTQ